MPKEKYQATIIKKQENTQAIGLLEAQLLKLPLPEQYDPMLQQSGPKLHRLAKLYRLGLCNFE